MHLPNTTPPCFSCTYFFDGERVLHLQGHLTMTESRLVAVQWGILVNCYLLLECDLAVLPCWVPHVAHTLLNTSNFSQPRYRHRVKGCRQESAGVWKVVQRLEVPVEHHRFIAACSKFDVIEISNHKISCYMVVYETSTVIFQMTINSTNHSEFHLLYQSSISPSLALPCLVSLSPLPPSSSSSFSPISLLLGQLLDVQLEDIWREELDMFTLTNLQWMKSLKLHSNCGTANIVWDSGKEGGEILLGDLGMPLWKGYYYLLIKTRVYRATKGLDAPVILSWSRKKNQHVLHLSRNKPLPFCFLVYFVVSR